MKNDVICLPVKDMDEVRNALIINDAFVKLCLLVVTKKLNKHL